jgi:hypothetical protein
MVIDTSAGLTYLLTSWSRPGSSVGTSVRLKIGRSAVRPRPWPPRVNHPNRPLTCKESGGAFVRSHPMVTDSVVPEVCQTASNKIVCATSVPKSGQPAAPQRRRDTPAGRRMWQTGLSHPLGRRRGNRPPDAKAAPLITQGGTLAVHVEARGPSGAGASLDEGRMCPGEQVSAVASERRRLPRGDQAVPRPRHRMAGAPPPLSEGGRALLAEWRLASPPISVRRTVARPLGRRGARVIERRADSRDYARLRRDHATSEVGHTWAGHPNGPLPMTVGSRTMNKEWRFIHHDR